MAEYKSRGIVLHTVKYGETSIIAFMLTDARGRQNYLVQGIGSGRSRGNRAALFQPLFPLEFIGLESPRSDLHRLKDLRAGSVLNGIPYDPRKSTIALFIAETLYRLVRELEPSSPLFDFTFESIQALDRLEEGVPNFHLWFMVRLSRYMGFHPGSYYTAGGWFDIQEGEFTPVMPQHRFVMDRNNARILSELMGCDPGSISQIALNRTERSDFLTAMTTFLGYHLDSVHEIRSLQILKEIF